MPEKVDDMKRYGKAEVADADADINDNIETINHIYENVPLRCSNQVQVPSMPEFHKYFQRNKAKTVIYENVCRGCGYGKFAAQGHYCNFCQCVVNGGVLAASLPAPPSLGEANIYENICELCRGIYSDNDQCECQQQQQHQQQQQLEVPNNGNDGNSNSNISNISNSIATSNTTNTNTNNDNSNTKSNKSRSLLSYSKSSAATLGRFFGSLRQLNRSGSLQRGNLKEMNGCGRGGRGGVGASSLEIIHNVDEVFHTQATFDMNQICELKQSSQSDQHIYGRLRVEQQQQQQQQRKLGQKRPRISRRRMLQQSKEEQDQDQDEKEEEEQEEEANAESELKQIGKPLSLSSIYLNESICQWMSLLRRDIHGYDDNLAVHQQPKPMPASYDRFQWNGDRDMEMELVKLRRPEQSLVDDFKRQLKNKHYQRRTPAEAPGGVAEAPDGLQMDISRRRGINEHHNAEFVNEFLKQLPQNEQRLQQQQQQRETVTLTSETSFQSRYQVIDQFSYSPRTDFSLPPILSLWQLMQSALLAASLHPSVRGFLCAYDKSLNMLLLHQQQQEQQQQRSAISIERWLHRCYRLRGRAKTVALGSPSTGCESGTGMVAGTGTSSSSSSSSTSTSQSRHRRLLPVVPATSASENVLLLRARPLASEAEPKLKPKIKTELQKEIETETATAKATATQTDTELRSSIEGAMLKLELESGQEQATVIGGNMAAPFKPKQIVDQCIDDNENANNNNNNNNIIVSDNNNICNSNSENNNDNSNRSSTQQLQQQINAQNCVVKLRRKAPQVPQRNPSTTLSTLKDISSTTEHQKEKEAERIQNQKVEEVEHMEQDEDEEEIENGDGDGNGNGDGDGEESIYQPIWQFKTLEPRLQHLPNESEVNDERDDEVAAAASHVVTKRPTAITSTACPTSSSLSPLPSPSPSPSPPPTPSLPSPTVSMDQSAWERAGDEFQFSNELETLSLGSTVTNSTATLGSISSSISNQSGSASAYNPGSATVVLIHPILRNICIIYSPKEPKKYSAIYYDYQRSLIHQRFMTRPPRIQKYHRPAPPIPSSSNNNHNDNSNSNSNQNDSGCSCEDPSGLDALKEDWALAVLAAAAGNTKRGAAAAQAAGPRSARKLRVRSQARLLLTDSVLAWREQLLRMDCCEDEEDMIVPVTDILRAQQIQEDNEVQQTQQTTILQRFKSASIGNLTDLPGEDDKKSIKNRLLVKFNVNGFRINRSPKSEKKRQARRSQVNSLYLDDQSKYPLFGAPLNVLELNMTDHPNVPRFVVDICAYIEQPDCIEQDGLYRASGNKLLVDELKRKLTHLYDPRFLQTDDIHTLTSLHKQFFRELSAPLITQEAYERLGRQLTDEGSIERMRLAFDDMPEPNRSTLRFLIKHLTKVAAASALNRMPASNLAIVWGPCLLTANQIQFDIGRMNMLAKVLIENHDRIFRPDNERLVC